MGLIFTAGMIKGELYTDDNGRYIVWFPDDWDRISVEGVDVAFVDPVEDSFKENINIISTHETGIRNTREYVLDVANEGIEEIQNYDPEAEVISEPSARVIAGHWSATYIIDMVQYGVTMRISQTVIVSVGYSMGFIITCSSLPSTFYNYQTTFEDCVNSFEILNEPDIETRSEGLILAILMGALIGGVAGLVIFIIVYSQKKGKDTVHEKPVHQQAAYPSYYPVYQQRIQPPRFPPPPPPPSEPPIQRYKGSKKR